MESAQGGELFQIFFLMGTQIVLALIAYSWGKRMSPSRKGRALICLVPIFGYLYFQWLLYTTIVYLLDKTSDEDC